MGPKNRRAHKIFRSWLIFSLLFSGFLLAVSLLSGYPGGQPAIPSVIVLLFPAVVLGVFHVAWYFYKGSE